jgi:hypothetical protein
MSLAEILKKIFEQSFAIGVLISIMLFVFIFLDWRLKDELKLNS